MDILRELFGEGKDLNALQMGCRSVVVFFIALLYIHLSGLRTFGKKSAFDNIITIMLGAVLSRGIVGASSFLPTMTAGLVMVLTHWLLARLSLHSRLLSKILKGEKKLLYANNHLINKNMVKSLVDEEEIRESVRLGANLNDLEQVKEIYMEGSGEISVIKKQNAG